MPTDHLNHRQHIFAPTPTHLSRRREHRAPKPVQRAGRIPHDHRAAAQSHSTRIQSMISGTPTNDRGPQAMIISNLLPEITATRLPANKIASRLGSTTMADRSRSDVSRPPAPRRVVSQIEGPTSVAPAWGSRGSILVITPSCPALDQFADAAGYPPQPHPSCGQDNLRRAVRVLSGGVDSGQLRYVEVQARRSSARSTWHGSEIPKLSTKDASGGPSLRDGFPRPSRRSWWSGVGIPSRRLPIPN